MASEIVIIEVGLTGLPGTGVTAAQWTDVTGRIATLEAGKGVLVKDETTTLATRAETLKFVGAGVVASGSGAEKIVNIPGASGVAAAESGSQVENPVNRFNFDSVDFYLNAPGGGDVSVKLRHYRTYNAYRVQTTNTAIGTTFTTIDTVDIGPLAAGVTYDVMVWVDLRGKVTSGSDDLFAVAQISGDSVSTGSRMSGADEQSVHAFAAKEVLGDGTNTPTLYARAVVESGAGVVTNAVIRAIAIPRQ